MRFAVGFDVRREIIKEAKRGGTGLCGLMIENRHENGNLMMRNESQKWE